MRPLILLMKNCERVTGFAARAHSPCARRVMGKAMDAQTDLEANAQANTLVADAIPVTATPEQAAATKAKNALLAAALMVLSSSLSDCV